MSRVFICLPLGPQIARGEPPQLRGNVAICLVVAEEPDSATEVYPMATPYPNVNQFNPLVQELRDSFDRECLPEGGFEALELEIRRTYARNCRCGLVRACMADALSGRWGFGSTQMELGCELGMDRSRVSDAATKGDISLDNFLMLVFHPSRRRDLEQRRFEFDVANRAGFIGVCHFLAQWEPGLQDAKSPSLKELDYELMCDVIEAYPEWLRARLTNTQELAFELVGQVLGDANRDVVPFWYTREDRARIKPLVDLLKSDASVAHAHLVRIHNHWIRVFVSAHSVTETLRWEGPL